MKYLFNKITYTFIILLLLVMGLGAPNKTEASSVQILDATNITQNSAILRLELSDADFVSHGFAIKKLSDTNLPTLDRLSIGPCTPDIEPNSNNPYSNNLERFQPLTLDINESYYYYGCAKNIQGQIVLSEVASFFMVPVAPGAENCEVVSMGFSPQNSWDTTFTLQLNGCEDGVRLRLKKIDSSGAHINTYINNLPNLLYPDQNGYLVVKFEADEDTCYENNAINSGTGFNWGYRCIAYIDIYNNQNQFIYSPNNETSILPGEINSRDEIYKKIDCLFVCSIGNHTSYNANNWDYISLVKGSGNSQITPCILVNSKNGSERDVWFNSIPDPENIVGKIAKLNIKTSTRCKNTSLSIKIMAIVWSEGFGPLQFGGIEKAVDIENSTGTDRIQVETGIEDIEISLKIGEHRCNNYSIVYSFEVDCYVYVEIAEEGKTIFSSKNFAEEIDANYNNYKTTINFKKGSLAYNCDGTCSGEAWKLLGVKGSVSFNDIGEPLNLGSKLDKNSPCYEETGVGSGSYIPGCYELLAPIPGIGEVYTDGDGQQRSTGFQIDPDTGRQYILVGEVELGDYINQLVRIALGLLVVIAVIMITVAGVEYMIVESISKKSNAKEHIQEALFGLLIGLSIFLILSIINPRLLDVNFTPPEIGISVNIITDSGSRIKVRYEKVFDSNNACSEIKNNTETCVPIDPKISLKPGIGQKIEKTMNTKLIILNSKLNVLIDGDWNITEAFKPTFQRHKDMCHRIGTCIDANFIGPKKANPSVQNVKDFILAADESGLCAIYEVASAQAREFFVGGANGLAPGKVLNLGGHISAPHFSVYNGTCIE